MHHANETGEWQISHRGAGFYPSVYCGWAAPKGQTLGLSVGSPGDTSRGFHRARPGRFRSSRGDAVAQGRAPIPVGALLLELLLASPNPASRPPQPQLCLSMSGAGCGGRGRHRFSEAQEGTKTMKKYLLTAVLVASFAAPPSPSSSRSPMTARGARCSATSLRTT
jgi:hypothetical protein